MLVDKMKEVQLVSESKLLKIDPIAKMLSRYDKTVYIKEPLVSSIQLTGTEPKYVEAAKFFNLLPEMASVQLTDTSCDITLKNGAKYKLAYYLTSWDDFYSELDLSKAYTTTIKLAAGRLSSATLKNLANPVLQCIYVDDATAVSCNSMVACIDGTVTTAVPVILPPDIISIIEGTEAKLSVIDNSVYMLSIGDGFVYVPIPQLDYSDAAATLRNALPTDPQKYPVASLFDSLKRLSSSHETVVFDGTRVVADEDFEPFEFPAANPYFVYNIQNLLSVVQQTKNMTQTDFALLFYGDKFLFMVSPEPIDESVTEE